MIKICNYGNRAWRENACCHTLRNNTVLMGELIFSLDEVEIFPFGILMRWWSFYWHVSELARVCHLGVVGNRMCYIMGSTIVFCRNHCLVVDTALNWSVVVYYWQLLNKDSLRVRSIHLKVSSVQDIRRRLSVTWASEVVVVLIVKAPIWRWRELWLIHSAC